MRSIESHLVACRREVRRNLLIHIVHMLSFVLCSSLFCCHIDKHTMIRPTFGFFKDRKLYDFSVRCDDAKSIMSMFGLSTSGNASTFLFQSRKLFNSSRLPRLYILLTSSGEVQQLSLGPGIRTLAFRSLTVRNPVFETYLTTRGNRVHEQQ